MDLIFPILSAVLQAASFSLDKVILSFRKIDFRAYIGISFPLIFFINLLIFFAFDSPISRELIYKTFWWLFASVALTIASNVIYYRALKHDKLSEMEVIGLLTALPVIIFSGIIFSDERNYVILIPAIIASIAIVWSHLKRGHLLIKKDTLPFLIWSLTMAPLAAAVSKILLADWNPISLEMLRMGVVTAAIMPFFQKQIKTISTSALWLLALTNVLTSVAWILFYFSYQRSGIIYTMLLFSIQPLLVYFVAIFILKEKIDRKKLIAFVVVLISIAIAQFYSWA
ncbi:hypothetical protein A3I27_01820 [Candidatus Giovannonibacteria bacterium RIFCSPLOWO2_02_FULL_43_11b]|uniref:EamA domain-containing protein n=1 Tax=Candidatus Giovannonibacteria bacterium RIFCSPHIGHO2_12_FULL_43_15 TaxID=1798341 RepID=A0A1F5WQM2_9BACT|nr:MAG: hypothetical protein A2739_01820 [Candidatus Giovannonibacteria bacterium RIFCSPHIGHO2_01_FULL_43_100]OGF67813.1 MAG: hypothetical protein A3B97_00850 [Candidatus Giovannonibacteria bacterium RIFCSPHIGHO2_02_FULL_43_32]OGF77973.1 MAG: hypothetical protein A3F23_03205 [Candidatus Giovannonibacteria bacterium RIFCSPHIGHO2_12_FULL_43_15]OGF79494.1 MAG: hypothetical protein A3A15_02070 [Candidatus Giovannonibacteria bacterium RIFCSPLOWO2_01_FULL_43_60]OGF89224.1 MAG: hypothetical protein A3